jgi:hypothetical protein
VHNLTLHMTYLNSKLSLYEAFFLFSFIILNIYVVHLNCLLKPH